MLCTGPGGLWAQGMVQSKARHIGGLAKRGRPAHIYYNLHIIWASPNPTFQMSDSLSNLFSHIKNAQRNRILVIEHFKSKESIAILNILQQNGYIRGFRVGPCREQPTPIHPAQAQSDKKAGPLWAPQSGAQKLQILLKYKNQKPAISELTRISKPSRRVYVSIDQLGPRSGAAPERRRPKRGHQTIEDVPEGDHTAQKDSRSGFFFMQGILILSTSKGILSHVTARRLGAGGEVIGHVC